MVFWSASGMKLVAITLAVPSVMAAGMDSRAGALGLRGGLSHPSSTDGAQSWNPCKTCEWGVRSVQDFVADPNHQEEVAKALESVTCSFFPRGEQPKCNKRIQAGIRHMVEVFEDQVSPSKICQPLCSAEDALYVSQKHTSTPYQHCSYCQFAASQLPEVAGQADDVNKVLLNVCQSLPPAFSQPCRDFMSEHGQDVAEASQAAPGTSACVASGLCPSPLIEAMAEVDLPEELHTALADGFSQIGAMTLQEVCSVDGSVTTFEDQECEFCKISVREARVKLADPVFQAAVEKYFKKMCTRTGDFEETCKEYIMQYGPIAFALAEQYLVPSKVCVFLHLCPFTPGPVSV